MIEQEKKNLSGLLLMLGVLMLAFILFEWMCSARIIQSPAYISIYLKLRGKSLFLRGLFVFISAVSCYFMPGRKLRRSMTENSRLFFLISAFLLTFFLILGPSENPFYNKYVYITVILFQLPCLALGILSIFGNTLKNEKFFKGVSDKKSDFFFEFKTDNGILRIHSPQQGVWIDGGTGSGKSDTFIKSIICQAAERGYAGWIYDWEGDPTKEQSPILSKVAYGSILKAKTKNPGLKLEFAFINFTDMSRTVRVNVLSERYFNPNNASLFIRNIVITLMKNLEPAWKEKTDFWANNAINYVYSVAYKCFKERASGINTLPHVISICLSDCEEVFRWIEEDQEIAKNMSSMLSAWKLGAQQQTAGAVSSAQLPLVLLNNKYIYWVLSAKPEEEFNLDITNREKPVMLCVGNAPNISEAVSPAISCIANIVMGQMNQPGKVPSIFLNDEFPTFIIYGIEKFISTVRKWGVATILALQNFSQAINNYGEKSAEIIKSNCGNQFFGTTSNEKTAESLEKLLGEKKEVNFSYSEQDSGSTSQSESFQKEKVMRMRDIAGQKTGHFLGKIANGTPPFFSCQFNRNTGYSEDIPTFAKMYNTGDPEKDNEIMEKIVKENYLRIEREVDALLSPFKDA